MQTNVLRLSGTLRALLNAGYQQYPAAQTAASLTLNGCLGSKQNDGGTTALRGPCPSGQSFIARSYAASTPSDKPDGPASQADSAAGTAASRPTFTTRLRDLLAVSSWRISKGEVGRLADVQGDLAAGQAAAASAQEAAGHPGTSAAAAAATDQAAASTSAQAATAPAGGAQLSPEQDLLQSQLLQGLQQQQQGLQEGEQQPQPAAPLQQEQQQPALQQRLLHPKYGYAALGGVVPAEEGPSTTGGLVGMLTTQHPRVNPRRRFMPGETYEPQELNPFSSHRTKGRPRPGGDLVRRPSAAEVMEKADYKNVAFLARWFLSPAGRLLSRRQTRLPVHVHKYVSRQIKLARHMGLMAGEARLDKLHLGRLREQELVEAQRRAAMEAAVAGVAVGVTPAGAAGAGAGGRGARLQQLAELGA